MFAFVIAGNRAGKPFNRLCPSLAKLNTTLRVERFTQPILIYKDGVLRYIHVGTCEMPENC
jgi:hypothetical protein